MDKEIKRKINQALEDYYSKLTEEEIREKGGELANFLYDETKLQTELIQKKEKETNTISPLFSELWTIHKGLFVKSFSSPTGTEMGSKKPHHFIWGFVKTFSD